MLLWLAAASSSPDGWEVRGHHIANYLTGVDHTVAQSGRASAYIRAVTRNPTGFRTVMQCIEPGGFRSKRLRLSGFLKTHEAETAGLWMRVEGRPPLIIAFDNMQSRPITGTVAWKRCEVVLDVPEGSRSLAYGFFLSGKGQVWADHLTLEIVGSDVPTTGLEQGRIELMNQVRRLPRTSQWGEGVAPRLAMPVNLDFEL
ncbi:MAG: hypothetical protein ACE15B_19685 [Bryobacteraceae bacterium]